MPETAPLQRFHPARWPLWGWVALTLAADALRVEYTLGAFSFGPAVALLAGTWLGSRRGALTQALATGLIAAASLVVSGLVSPAEWGYRIGHIAAAAAAGQFVPAGSRGAHQPPKIKWIVAAAAVATAATVASTGTQLGPPPAGRYFALVFLMAAVIAIFYAWRVVPEPARVVGYAYCLLPYYALGLGWSWAFVRAFPEASGAAALGSLDGILFHGYLAHLPGDVIGLVVIAYLVCATGPGGRAGATDAGEPGDATDPGGHASAEQSRGGS